MECDLTVWTKTTAPNSCVQNYKNVSAIEIMWERVHVAIESRVTAMAASDRKEMIEMEFTLVGLAVLKCNVSLRIIVSFVCWQKRGGKAVKRHADIHCKGENGKQNANQIEFIKWCIYHFACFLIRIILLSVFFVCMRYKSFIDFRASRPSFYFVGRKWYRYIWYDLACVHADNFYTAPKTTVQSHCSNKHRHRSITHFTMI